MQKKRLQEKNNGLTEISIRSIVNPPAAVSISSLDALQQMVQSNMKSSPQYGVFYLDYGIKIGKWENGGFAFYGSKPDLSYLQLARIFNKDKELKIWRASEGYMYRLRDDTQGDLCHAVEARQYLWGTRAEPLGDGWTRLYEERGTEVILPLAIAHTEGNSLPLARVHTRNYIGYPHNNQASYVDCRFVAFEKK